MCAAIHYHPEAYSTTGPKLMGRNAAGESFLNGLIRHAGWETLWVQVQRVEHAQALARQIQASGRNMAVRAVDKNSLAALAQPGVLYTPGPGLAEHAFQRAVFGHGRWSLCGITHTTASAGAMDAISQLLLAPVQPWDALICTSNAVKSHVEHLFQAQIDYLRQRLGITKAVFPQLPVIPLGVHVDQFDFTAQQRREARQALEVSDTDCVILFMGRLSFHAKAHPLAMYQALESAAQQAGQRLVLVECGWHANAYIEQAYQTAARQFCPHVRVITLDGRQPDQRRRAWASADIFCSLSDNIQETFGIVPIEAMAAAMPVVVSDWDGYKDTVREGVDGYRIPTLMPQPGLGGDLALRHALEQDTYDMYCGYTSSLVAVDVSVAAAAITQLVKSPALRKRMGRAGRERAKASYDWSAIIPRYQQLWQELNQRRTRKSAQLGPAPHPWPARTDPFTGFAAYPSYTLGPETLLSRVDSELDRALERLSAMRQLAMVNFANAILPTDAEARTLLAAVGAGPIPAQQLIAPFPAGRQPHLLRALVWLVKLNLLRHQPGAQAQLIER